MKYLKYINENYRIEHHNGYKEIDESEFEYYIWTPLYCQPSLSMSMYFTKRETDYIMKEFPNYMSSSYSENNVTINKRYLWVSIPDWALIISNSKESIFYIVKLPDEWYYVFDSFNQQFFECDQIEELIDCLKNQLSIAKEEKLLENSHNQFYQEISSDEFNELTKFDDYHDMWEIDFVRSEWIDFTKKEVDSIKKLLPNNNIINEYTYREYFGFHIGFKNFTTKGFIVSHPNPKFKPQIYDRPDQLSTNFWIDIEFYIIKLKDEWYYFCDQKSNKKYKCDQFEGLVKLIKDYKLSYKL